MLMLHLITRGNQDGLLVCMRMNAAGANIVSCRDQLTRGATLSLVLSFVYFYLLLHGSREQSREPQAANGLELVKLFLTAIMMSKCWRSPRTC
jgi:hypothetical protein